MTHRCFSSSRLYALRNEIDVRMLIEKMHIPCRVTKGCFRFLCPLCSEYDTAVNPKTNLARCFQCEKNFNTIDLVMITRQAKFVDSVKFLQSIHQKDDQNQNHQFQERINPKTPSRQSEKTPQSIGEIFDSIFPPIHGGIAENLKVSSKSYNPMAVRKLTVENRIVKLEKKLTILEHQINKIARTLNVRSASE
jgi:hypothetical protein